MDSYKPLVAAIREAIEDSPKTFDQVAAELGMKRSSLSMRLRKDAPLDVANRRDHAWVLKLCGVLDIGIDDLKRRSDEIERERRTEALDARKGRMDPVLAELAVATLYDVNAPQKSRELARDALYRLLGFETEEVSDQN